MLQALFLYEISRELELLSLHFVTNKDEVLGPVGGSEDQDEDMER